MGNQLAVSGAAASVNLHDISDNLSLVAPLGGAKRGRLFTSLHCRQINNGAEVVVKVFVQRQDDKDMSAAVAKSQTELTMADARVRAYYRQLPYAPCNLLFYSVMEKSRTGAYCLLQRPFLPNSLAERLQMRPFWEPCQRLFACYQLLQALVQMHDKCDVVHGDLKPENILVHSTGWLYLTDFSPFKPPTMPFDNPANFEYFYDNSETRNCCCAPEKFCTTLENRFGHTKKSDVFSVACCMVYILTDEPLFKLSGVLEFRQMETHQREEWLENELRKRRVGASVVGMLKEMMCVPQDLRPSASSLLKKYVPSVFPNVFGMLYANVFPTVLIKAPDAQVHFIYTRYNDIMRSADYCASSTAFSSAISVIDDRTLVGKSEQEIEASKVEALTEFDQVSVPVHIESRMAVATLLTPLLTTTTRFLRTTDVRTKAVQLMRKWAEFGSSKLRRDVMLPWARQVFQSKKAGTIPRVHALRTMHFILQSIEELPRAESYLFEDYILDAIEGVLREPGIIPSSMGAMQPLIALLTELALSLPSMLCIGRRFVIQRYQDPANSASPAPHSEVPMELVRDAAMNEDLKELSERGWECIKALLGSGCSSVEIDVLRQIGTFCSVIGPERTVADLMPQLTTFLSSNVVEVKTELVRQIPFLARFTVMESTNEAHTTLLLMTMEDGLRQHDVECVCVALQSTQILAVERTLPIKLLMTLVKTSLNHLLCRTEWVRNEAIRLLQVVARAYSPSDLMLHLLRPIRPFLLKPVPLANLWDFRHLVVRSEVADEDPISTVPCADFLTYVSDPFRYLAITGHPRGKDDIRHTSHMDIYAPTYHRFLLPTVIGKGRSTTTTGQMASKALGSYDEYDVPVAAESEGLIWRMFEFKADERSRKRITARRAQVGVEATAVKSRPSVFADWDTNTHVSHPSTKTKTEPSVGASAATTIAPLRPNGATLLSYQPESDVTITCMSTAGGHIVTGGHNGLVQLWDVDEASRSNYLYPHTVSNVVSKHSVAFVQHLDPTVVSPVVIGSSNGTMTLFDPENDAIHGVHIHREGALRSCCAFNSNVMLVTAASGCIFAVDWRVRRPHVWKAYLSDKQGSGNCILPLSTVQPNSYSGGTIASSSIWANPGDEPVGCVVGSDTGRLVIFDLRFRLNTVDYTIPSSSNKMSEVTSISGNPISTYKSEPQVSILASLSTGEITSVNLATGRSNLSLCPSTKASTSHAIMSLNCTSSVYTGGGDGLVRVWDLNTPQNSRTLCCSAEQSGVYSYNSRFQQVVESPSPAPIQSHHNDCISVINTVIVRGVEECLVTGGRSGSLNVWRNMPKI